MNKATSITIGILLAILSCGILIYAFETDRSFAQIIIAFGVLFLPIAFISSINGKVAIFLLSSILILGGYICFKQDWYDTSFGVLLALLLGGATYFFRVSKVETFSASEHKQEQKNKQNAR
jgi:membrane-associated HD superfamily phosphohydrolase